MSNQDLLEKLQLNDEKNLLIQGLPSSIEKQFIKLSYAKNVTPLLKSKKVDFALVFAVNLNQLNNVLKELFPALHDNTKLWVAYPKQASKIVSDLNRDCSWEMLTQNLYEGVSLVSLDNVWSAMRFKKTVSSNRAKVAPEKKIEIEIIDFEEKLEVPPMELERVFTKHKKAK
jgi:hypothetical protein